MKVRKDTKAVSIKGMILLVLVIAIAVIVRNGFVGNSNWYWVLLPIIPLFTILLAFTRKRSYKRNVRNRKHYSSLN